MLFRLPTNALSKSAYSSEQGSFLNTTLLPRNQMAARSSCHPSTSSMALAPRFGTRKATLRFSTSAHGCNPSHLSLAASANKKVFEDQLRGIVCYVDENGELVCEGYDEGPRLGTRLPEKSCFPWPVGVEVTDFIQLATLRVFEDADVLQFKNDQNKQL